MYIIKVWGFTCSKLSSNTNLLKETVSIIKPKFLQSVSLLSQSIRRMQTCLPHSEQNITHGVHCLVSDFLVSPQNGLGLRFEQALVSDKPEAWINVKF